MSETFKKPAKRPASKSLRSIALLGLLLSFVSGHAIGEGLDAYGARLCAEAGIPLENCSLVTDPAVVRNAESVRNEAFERRGDKTATLIEHGRRVCEQENVPLEDCQALPSAYRAEHAPAPAFLTVPAALPPVDRALLPAASPPPPVARRIVRDVPPPAPLPRRPIPATSVSALPIQPDVRYFRPPSPVSEPFAFRDGAPPPPVYRRRSPVFVEERTQRPERFRREESFRREERFRREEPSGRCFRAVRYSRPPSYRYVTC